MGNASACCNDNRTAVEKQIQEFLWMIKRMPTLTKYMASKTNSLTYTKSWASTVFGGSVLNPLGARMKKRTRTNPLSEQISGAQINALYGGGYYILERV